MERSRITARLRPRPYDLRRKVLLKNFFREQMTYIPPVRSTVETPLDADINSDSVENELNSNTNEGNILTPKKVQDNIVTPVAVSEPAPSTSSSSEKENSHNLETPSHENSSNPYEVGERPRSKFSRFSRIIESIDSHLSKKNRRKGITKAKHELGSSRVILKPAGRKIITDTKSSAKGKAKSFFERFKSRRDRKRNKQQTSKISNMFALHSSSPSKCDSKAPATSTQSVQTDASWSPDQYEKMKQSNISLLEENRLLSESLSSIIINSDYSRGSTQNSCCTDSYAKCSNESAAHHNPVKIPSAPTKGKRTDFQQDVSRTRILRSKSMQNRNEKKSLATSRPRTRSFTCRFKTPYTNQFLVTNQLYRKQCCYREDPISSPIPSCAKTRPLVLPNVDVSPSYNTKTSSLLQTLSTKSSKALVRRSSMPERAYNWNNKARPVRCSSMRENNHYSMDHVSSHPNQSSHHRRSSTLNGYPWTVPYKDRPVEAFY